MTTAKKVDPLCCGIPMVHNSWTGEFACADAYFYLVDEVGPNEVLCFMARDQIPAEYREAWDHWRASFVPDGWSQ